jgi:hypothetical protein
MDNSAKSQILGNEKIKSNFKKLKNIALDLQILMCFRIHLPCALGWEKPTQVRYIAFPECQGHTQLLPCPRKLILGMPPP